MPVSLHERYAQVVGFLKPSPIRRNFKACSAVAECKEESIDMCIRAYWLHELAGICECRLSSLAHDLISTSTMAAVREYPHLSKMVRRMKWVPMDDELREAYKNCIIPQHPRRKAFLAKCIAMSFLP